MEPNFFDEKDLKNLFPDYQPENKEKSLDIEFEPEKTTPEPPKPEKTTNTPIWKTSAKFAGLFVAIFLVSFLLVNFSALSKQFIYFWEVTLRHGSYKNALAIPEQSIVPTPNFNPAKSANLIIAKIGVNAPIIWNISEDQVHSQLTEGVVHSLGTALPGQKGNVFITGHSSYYSWSTSPYKDIFALLEKVSVGDQILVQYEDKTFSYTVTETKVVSPNDLSVLEQGQDYNLTLMTCVPIGTNLNRLIITAKQD